MPAWLQIFLLVVNISGILGGIILGTLRGWVNTKAVNSAVDAAAQIKEATETVHKIKTENALWQEIAILRKDLTEMREELEKVKQEKHNWRSRAFTLKVRYVQAHTRHDFMRTLLLAARADIAQLRTQLGLPSAVYLGDGDAMTFILPEVESIMSDKHSEEPVDVVV